MSKILSQSTSGPGTGGLISGMGAKSFMRGRFGPKGRKKVSKSGFSHIWHPHSAHTTFLYPQTLSDYHKYPIKAGAGLGGPGGPTLGFAGSWNPDGLIANRQRRSGIGNICRTPDSLCLEYHYSAHVVIRHPNAFWSCIVINTS